MKDFRYYIESLENSRNFYTLYIYLDNDIKFTDGSKPSFFQANFQELEYVKQYVAEFEKMIDKKEDDIKTKIFLKNLNKFKKHLSKQKVKDFNIGGNQEIKFTVIEIPTKIYRCGPIKPM